MAQQTRRTLKKAASAHKVPSKQVPRPIIALASPTTEQPTVKIERMKAGEYKLVLTATGSTAARARESAVREFRLLIAQGIELETYERSLRQDAALERVNAKAAKAPDEEAGQ